MSVHAVCVPDPNSVHDDEEEEEEHDVQGEMDVNPDL